MSSLLSRQVEVVIMGQSYVLSCPAGGEGMLREAVEQVNLSMQKIRDAGKIKSRDRIAVLAAIHIAYETIERAQADLPPIPTHSEDDPPSEEAIVLHRLIHRVDRALNPGESDD